MNISSLSPICVASSVDYRKLILYLNEHVGRPEPYSGIKMIDGRLSFVRNFSYSVLFIILKKRFERLSNKSSTFTTTDLRYSRLLTLKHLHRSHVQLHILPHGTIDTSSLTVFFSSKPLVIRDSILIKTYLRYVGII